MSKRFSSSSSKARKQKDLNAVGNVLKPGSDPRRYFLGRLDRVCRVEEHVSEASVARRRNTFVSWRDEELEKAREMLRGRYEAAYEDIEQEFSVFSDDSQLQTYSDMFASMTERGRMEIWERATEKFYSRAEYDANGETERAKKQKEAHGTF